MKINLVSSLHLNHSGVSADTSCGDPLLMQAFVPMGLLSLKATADQAGLSADIRVSELNGLINGGSIANDNDFYDHLIDAVVQPDDDLVGLMTDADSLHHTVAIADLIKRRSPQTLVCLGGPAASPIGHSLLEAFDFVDFVVRGEGELTFAELVHSLHRGQGPAGIRGLTWRDRDGVSDNPERPLVDNLDDLPVPFHDAYAMNPAAALYLDVGRGCPFTCSFCGTAPFWKRKYRMKSIDRILREMTLVRDRYGRRHVNFSHDIFSCNRDWTHQFCEQLSEARLGMTWTCSTRTDLMDGALAADMAKAGCSEIYYGIESGSQAGQSQIQKDLDLDQARDIVRSTAAAGIHPITGFIVGYPTETFETLGATLRKFFEFLNVGGFRAHLFPLCPYHDAPLYRDNWPSAVQPAECYDLPLDGAARARGENLRQRYPVIFASTHRYSCPQIPRKFVAASEELSANLVVIKSIWPLLLPHYDSPLDWYVRWVDWIESHNAKQRPATRWPHQGDVGDLLLFVTAELSRLNLADSALADLVRYEQLKWDACRLQSPDVVHKQPREPIDVDTVVVRRCGYVAAAFRRDIRTLLAGQGAPEVAQSDERWVVCFRNVQGDLKTIDMPALGRCILEIAEQPRRVADLLAGILTAAAAEKTGAERLVAGGMNLIRQLVGHGLLEEVAYQ